MYNLILSGMRSPYAENHLGDFFYSTVLAHKPVLVVELGAFMGYSALHMAAALRDNKVTRSELHVIDLWEKNPSCDCSMDAIVQNFDRNELLTLQHCKVSFVNDDAFEAHSKYQADSIDLLHVDIRNDGESLQRCINSWHGKLKPGGVLLFEGGSVERDSVDWMTESARRPIRSFTQSDWFKKHYEAVTMQPFPSLTFARKLR